MTAPDPRVDQIAEVLAAHVIECTGLGEVTCRGCRDRGWMHWSAWQRHVAEQVAAIPMVVTAEQVRATARHSHALHGHADPEYVIRQVLSGLGVTVREDEGGEGRG